MKELIVSNFIKKYVARTDPEADLSSGFYVRLTRALGEQVDRYLSEPTAQGSPGKSVRVLEDSLWEVALSLGGPAPKGKLPSIQETYRSVGLMR